MNRNYSIGGTLVILVAFLLLVWPGWLIGGPLWDRFSRPTAELNVDKTTIRPGQSVKLTWKTNKADTVTLNDEDVETKGAQIVSPAEDADYVLVAANDKGEETRTVKVSVKGKPVTSPSPTTVKPSESAKAAPSESAKTSASAQSASQPATSQSQLGCAGKDVGAVQALIGLSVVCLGTEYDAYTWRSVPIKVNATVPEGWIATLHLSGDKIVVTEKSGTYEIVAGTFRRKSGYPSVDAVHNACGLLAKEQAFGASQTPSFPVEAMGFSCDGKVSVQSQPAQPAPAAVQQPAQAAPAPATTKPGNTCLTLANVTNIIGGANWREIPGSNGEGLKYGPATPVMLKAPDHGRLDSPSGSARNGQTTTANEATYWCNG